MRFIQQHLNKLSLSHTFVLVGAVILLAMSYISTSLYKTSQTNIEFSALERVGTRYIEPIPRLLTQFAAYRHAAQPDLGNTINQGLTALQTHQQQAGKQLNTDGTWQSLKESWPTKGQSEEPTTHTMALMGAACDNSNLTLDPDIDSYYLMDNVCARLPTMITLLGEQYRLASIALTTKQLDATAKTRLIELKPLLRNAQDAMQTNFSKVFAYNKDLATVFGDTTSTLAQRQNQFSELIQVSVLGEQLDAAPANLQRDFEQLQSLTLQLTETTLKQLDALLLTRIQRLQTDRNIHVGIAVLAIVVTLVLFVAMYRSLIAQLGGEPRYAAQIVSDITAGRLDTPIDLRPDDQSSLLASMTIMQKRLRDFVDQTLAACDQLAQSADQLASTTHSISAASHTQSEAAGSVAAATEQLVTSIAHSAEYADQAQTLSKDAVNATDTGNEVIGNAVRTMHTISSVVNDANAAIQQLTSQSEEIGKVVAVIREVADQTNLLALNASIEAARAGEMGRGFAVVADEVRKLAERTTVATAEINRMVGNIQRGTREVSASMEREVSEVNLGVAHAGKAGDAIVSIRDMSGQSARVICEIADALREQQAASTAVAKHIEKIANMAEENSTAVQRSVSATSDLNQLAQRLRQTVSFFKIRLP
ncbi:methyl-accepting chemotaxis protein [Chitinivorax sp. B]|uniref:methyl-accepting chemotaxis protein n=1 Tax=Chitinivorax sp. B TaxID=2502235 RepID=UPI0010F86FB8|nr:methyl-accepting chemotaxis protein [Chitinivorax sp. B]